MAMLDTSIAVLVIVALILVVWARVTRQTIPELVGGLIDVIREKSEDSKETILENG